MRPVVGLRMNRHATRDSLPQTRIRTSEIPGVLKRVASGELYKSIAKDYGVSRQTIGNIAIKNGVRRRQYGQ